MRTLILITTLLLTSCGDEKTTNEVTIINNCEIIFNQCVADAQQHAEGTASAISECEQDFNICTSDFSEEDNDSKGDTNNNADLL